MAPASIQSSLTTKSGDIAYRLGLQSALDTVAIFGATAGSAQVILYDTSVSRVNLATYSDEFDNAAHTSTRCSVTANIYQDPLGSYQGDALFEFGLQRIRIPVVAIACGRTKSVFVGIQKYVG